MALRGNRRNSRLTYQPSKPGVGNGNHSIRYKTIIDVIGTGEFMRLHTEVKNIKQEDVFSPHVCAREFQEHSN